MQSEQRLSVNIAEWSKLLPQSSMKSSMQSYHSKSSQQNEMKNKFLNYPITVAKKEVKSGWLIDIDKLTYPTYLLNAFYLLEIRNFLELVLNSESDNLFRINQIQGEQSKLIDGQLLKTFSPSVTKQEKQDYIYQGNKFSIQLQKKGKLLKRNILKDGFITGDGVLIVKKNSQITYLFKDVVQSKIELNLELKIQIQNQGIDSPRQISDMPSLGNMHSQGSAINIIQQEQTNSFYFGDKFKYNPAVPWLNKQSIFRLSLTFYTKDIKTKQEKSEQILLYFDILRNALKLRDYLRIQKLNVQRYQKVFTAASTFVKCVFTSTFYDECIHSYKIYLQNSTIKENAQSESSFTLDSSSTPQSNFPVTSTQKSNQSKPLKSRKSEKYEIEQMQQISLFNQLGQSDGFHNQQNNSQNMFQDQLNEVIRPIDKENETDEYAKIRKNTAEFSLTEDQQEQQQKQSQKQRLSLTSPQYLYKPDNFGIIKETEDEQKNIKPIKRNSQVRFVNSSSNQSYERITEKSEKSQTNKTEESLIDHLNNKINLYETQEQEKINKKKQMTEEEAKKIIGRKLNQKMERKRTQQQNDLSKRPLSKSVAITSKIEIKRDQEKEIQIGRNLNAESRKSQMMEKIEVKQNMTEDEAKQIISRSLKKKMQQRQPKNIFSDNSPTFSPQLSESQKLQPLFQQSQQSFKDNQQSFKDNQQSFKDNQQSFKDNQEDQFYYYPEPQQLTKVQSKPQSEFQSSQSNKSNSHSSHKQQQQKKQSQQLQKQVIMVDPQYSFKEQTFNVAQPQTITQVQPIQENPIQKRDSSLSQFSDQRSNKSQQNIVQQLLNTNDSKNQQNSRHSSQDQQKIQSLIKPLDDSQEKGKKQQTDQPIQQPQQERKPSPFMQKRLENKKLKEQQHQLQKNQQTPLLTQQQSQNQQVKQPMNINEQEQLIIEKKMEKKNSSFFTSSQEEFLLMANQNYKQKQGQTPPASNKDENKDEEFQDSQWIIKQQSRNSVQLQQNKNNQDNSLISYMNEVREKNPDSIQEDQQSEKLNQINSEQNNEIYQATYKYEDIYQKLLEDRKPKKQQEQLKPTINIAEMFKDYQINDTLSEGKEKSQAIQSIENSIRYHEYHESEQKEYSFNPVQEEMDVEIINDQENMTAQQISASIKPSKNFQEQNYPTQSNVQSIMQFSNLYNASMNESSQKTQELLNSQKLNSQDINNSYSQAKNQIDNSITEENYNQYLDINRPPKYTRNMILCNKVQAMIKDQKNVPQSELESIRIEKEELMEIKEISNMQTEISLIEEFAPQSTPKILKYQKPVKVYLKVCQNKDSKILYQNEWYSFDLYLNLEKQDTQRKKTPLKTKRDISPIAPDSITRQVYQEFGMLKREKESEKIFDWNIKMIKNQISINALKRRRRENIMRFYIDLDVQHLIDFDEKQFQHFLFFLGMLLQGQILDPLDKLMQRNKDKSFINQTKELEINGFNLKYIHCGFMHVVNQLQKQYLLIFNYQNILIIYQYIIYILSFL